MVPGIIIHFFTNDQQDAAVWDNLLFHCSLTAVHVSSNIIAHHQEHLNCSYSFWFIHCNKELSFSVLCYTNVIDKTNLIRSYDKYTKYIHLS